MIEPFKMSEQLQNVSKDGFGAAIASFGELTKRSQAIGAELIFFFKKGGRGWFARL